MAEKKMCPHCGSQMFMTKIIRAGLAEFTTDPNEPCKILKESKDKFDIEIVGCARCKQEVTVNDLITGVKCKECGKVVSPNDISEDGICNVCEAVKQRAELANASKEDLIKMLLDAEKKINPVAIKMEKQIEKADETDSTVTQITSANEDNVSGTTTEESTEKKKRTKTRKKKVDENDTVEPEKEDEETTEVSEVVTDSDVKDTVDDIANQQEAPFPDIAMNLPEEPVVTTVQPIESNNEQPIGADFHMFDEEEEAF